MAPGPNNRLEKASSSTSAVHEEHQAVEKANNENKSPRHPRWTKQETLILIEGKKIAESQGRKGCRSSSSVFGTDQLELKAHTAAAYRVAPLTVNVDGKETDETCAADTEDDNDNEEDEGKETVQSSIAVIMRGQKQISFQILNSVSRENFEGPTDKSCKRKSKKQFPYSNALIRSSKRKTAGSHYWRRTAFQEGVERRRLPLDGCEDINLSHHLIKVLERNTNVLNAQLEAQIMDSQLEREQQKDRQDF
ncbi:hypothetical protein ACH5RR_008388 [Cinchona calisaya]|uniref:Uncharacterized protein n=1 Tax=Cinchona calisaya TaxID=153742 RepID=A0ABD3AB88_9GENT